LSRGNIEEELAYELAKKAEKTRKAPHYLDTGICSKRYRENARR
jgi:hypothetical protein